MCCPNTLGPCEFMESDGEKPLKPYPVGLGGGARQAIWFRKKRESGFGLVGRIKNLRGPLSDEHPFIKVVVMGRCLISHVM